MRPSNPDFDDDAGAESESDRGPTMPNWVKVQGIILLVLVLLVLAMLAPALFGLEGGGHGPAAHTSGGR